jgi:hypothetical protein
MTKLQIEAPMSTEGLDCTSGSCLDKKLKFCHISGLYKNRARALKAAYKTFTSLQTSHSSTSGFFDRIFTVPCHKMAIVNDVFFV